MNYADIKARARLDRHKAFAVPVQFYPKGQRTPLALVPPITARLHNRVTVAADPTGGGYAQITEGITRVIMSRVELAAASLVPKQGDRLVFGPPFDVAVQLDTKDTPNGPVVERWNVSRK